MSQDPALTSRAMRRWLAFAEERAQGADIRAAEAGDAEGAFAPQEPLLSPAAARREALREFRRRSAAASSVGSPPSGPGFEAEAPQAIPQLNWIPLGPGAIRRGQASGEPVVTGRVQEVCVSEDGQRVYVASANGGVWRSTDAGRTWEPTMDRLDENPQRTQADTLACGALVLVDGGAQDSDRLYLGTGEGTGAIDDFRGTGMWLSTDGGTTWVEEPARLDTHPTGGLNALEGYGVLAMALDPADHEHVVAATTRGLFRRSGSGSAAMWTREAMPGGSGLPSTAARFTGVAVGRSGATTRVCAITDEGLPITSTRAGSSDSTWAALGTGFPATQVGRCTIAVASDDPDIVYVLAANSRPPAPAAGSSTPVSASFGFLHGIYRLDLSDSSPTWRQVTGVPTELFGNGPSFQGWYDQAVAVDPDDANTVFLGGSHAGGPASVYRCVVSDSSGTLTASCTNIGERVHPDIHGLTFRAGTRQLWVGCDGGVFVTDDAHGGPELFEARNTGLAVVTMQSMAYIDEGFGFGGVQDNGGARWTGSEIWDHQLAGDGGATLIHAESGAELLNGYTDSSIRRQATDAPRYERSQANVTLGTRVDGTTTHNEEVAFYPPIVACPDQADLVAFGAQRPYVSDQFGGDWVALPLPTGHTIASGEPTLRSLAFVSATRLLGGYTNGRIYRWDRPSVASTTWSAPVSLDAGLSVGNRPITCIAVDRADADNDFYVTVGGGIGVQRVWHAEVTGPPRSPSVTWRARSGSGATSLLDSQHNVLVVHPDDSDHLYVGADIGVWRSTDAGLTWQPFSPGLPDSAVFDLAIIEIPGEPEPMRLLRAATHGRGAWEIPLEFRAAGPDSDVPWPQRGIELYLRANNIDQRRRPRARTGITVPADRTTASTLVASPDLLVDPPRPDGQHAISLDRPVDLVEVEDRCTGSSVALSIRDTVVHTQVHLVARNRGIAPADDATATLLVGRILASDDDTVSPTIPDLPDDWADSVRTASAIDTGTWKTVGVRPLPSPVAGRPGIVTFDLPSDALLTQTEGEGVTYALLAVVRDPNDELPDGPTNVSELVATSRHTALRVVSGVVGPGPVSGTPGSTGLLVPLSTVLLAFQRLSAAVKALETKASAAAAPPAGSHAPTVQPTDRRVLALMKAARDNLAAGPAAPVPAGRPGHGIGQSALLGALGYEIPGYTGLLAPGGAWTADAVRRGTADPDTSLVRVLATELPLAVARSASAHTGGDHGQEAAVRGFATGMVGAAGAGMSVGPVLADLLAQETHRDWSRHTPSVGAGAVGDALRARLLLAADGQPASVVSWLPPANAVPDAIWEGLATAISSSVGTGASRPTGFAGFEAGFEPGDEVSAVRLRNAYGLLLDDVTTGSWPAIAWWALLVPLAMSWPISMLVTRALPHGRQFFTDGVDVDERGLFEALMAGQTVGAVTPFVYSMILWGLVDEHTDPFVNALILGIVRGTLGTAALATASDDDLSALARWLGFFLPLQVADIYAAIRAAVAGDNRPGDRFVFALNATPSVNAWLTAGLSAVLKAAGISHTPAGFWAPWGVLSAGLLGGAIPIALALERGGGYRSWFLRDHPPLPLLSATRDVVAPRIEPLAQARVFTDDVLWVPPSAETSDLTAQRYPSGARHLLAIWFDGTGDLEVNPGGDEIRLRVSGGTPTTVDVPEDSTPNDVADALRAALDGVHAEVLATDDPPIALTSPALSDPSDALGLIDAEAAVSRFVPVGRTRDEAAVVRHAPRTERSVAVGPRSDVTGSFPVVPPSFPVVPTSRNMPTLSGTALGDAADLAALLASAAAPSLAQVRVADALPGLPEPLVREVVQVFKRWNLDERRLEEWRQLVRGSATGDPEPASDAVDPMLREVDQAAAGQPYPEGRDVALAMGWVPLWRAWLAVASDALADTAAATAHADAPMVTMPDGERRPTNAELTGGIKYLLDLGDPDPAGPGTSGGASTGTGSQPHGEDDSMAQTVHLELTLGGEEIDGESTVTSLDRENTIECWSFAVEAQRSGGASGPAAGNLELGQIAVTKPIDRSTPQLMQGLVNAGLVDTARFRFFRPSSSGSDEHFFTVELSDGRIVSIEQESKDETAGGASAPPPLERVTFVAESITWTHEPSGVTFSLSP